jgi:hypothetical protein
MVTGEPLFPFSRHAALLYSTAVWFRSATVYSCSVVFPFCILPSLFTSVYEQPTFMFISL